jgi:uncharacterized protein
MKNGSYSIAIFALLVSCPLFSMIKQGVPEPKISNLMQVVLEGNLDNVNDLLAKGANVNEQDAKGNNALMIAASKGYVKIVERLLEVGANVNVQEKDGWTALIIAAMNSNIEIAQMLLDAKADPNIQDNVGKTALMYAASFGFPDMVALLKAHSPVDLKDKKGKTAQMQAIEHDQKEFADYIQSKNTVYSLTNLCIAKIVKCILAKELEKELNRETLKILPPDLSAKILAYLQVFEPQKIEENKN